MSRAFRVLVVPALAIVWLLMTALVYVVISHYDFLHITFLPLQVDAAHLLSGIQPGEYVVGLLQAFAGVAVFAAASTSLGLIVLGGNGDWLKDRLILAVTAYLIGEIILSVVFLSILAAFRLTPAMTIALIALPLLIGGRRLIAFVLKGGRVRLPGLAGLAWAERVMLGMTAAGMLIASMYTASILNYDSVVQYFSQAKIMAATQLPVHLYPKDPFFVSMLHPTILFTALIQTFGDQAARMLSWWNGLLIVLLGLAIGKECGLSFRARTWFVAALLSSTFFVDLLGDGKVELISTAPMLAAVFWMVRSLQRPRRVKFLLIGALVGFAMVARAYNLFLAPLFVIIFYGFNAFLRRRAQGFDLRQYAITAGWMLPTLLFMGAFHLAQNLLWLGDPLAPLTAGRALTTSDWPWQFSPALLNFYRLVYPFTATFANSPQSMGNVTPLLVGFLPFLLMKPVRQVLTDGALLRLSVPALATLVPWLLLFFTVVELRYVLFIWVLLFLVLGAVIERALPEIKPPVSLLAVPLACVLLAYMGFRTFAIALETYAPVDTQGQAHCDSLIFCSFMQKLNTVAAPGDRVFVASAYRYYLRPDLFACSSRAEEYPALEALARRKSSLFWASLYQAGFRYVTFEDNYSVFHNGFTELPPPELAPGWLRVRQLYVSPDGLERIYMLESPSPPAKPNTYCEHEPSGTWEVVPGGPSQ